MVGAENICFAPVVWVTTDLEEVDGQPGVYKALPPQPRDGHWTGYYIEMEFEGDHPDRGDKFFPNHFTFTTPGYVWPDTMPFDDCVKEGCWSKMV